MYVDTKVVTHALENDQIVPTFQPLVELSTGALSGFEILARWQSPEHGLVLPANLISIAEENGLIGTLTSQLLAKAFLHAPLIHKPLSLAVNISPVQMRYASLPGQIREAAESAGFPLNRLTIEITESSLMQDLPRVQRVAAELKEMGCCLALDDFGTGFSSLSNLQAIQFTHVKIDRSFVNNMTTNRDSRKIVSAIVGLGHSLGLEIVAEGIETEEQAEMLQWLGCECGQGWLYGKPAPAEDLAKMIARPDRIVCTTTSKHGEGRAVSSFETVAQLQAIYDGAPVGLAFLDSDLRHVTMNRQLAELTGISVSDYRGKTVEEMVSPEMYTEIKPLLLRALKGETMSNIEIERPAAVPGGKPRTTLMSYLPALDEANEVIGVSVAVVEITSLKEEAELLRANTADTHRMLERHPQAAWTMDAKGKHLNVTQPWAQMTGFSEEWTRHLGWLEGVHSKDGPAVRRAVKHALRTGNSIDIEYRVRCVDGDWRWMRARGTPRYGTGGEIVNWYGCIEDVQESRQLRADLLEAQLQNQSLFQALRSQLALTARPEQDKNVFHM